VKPVDGRAGGSILFDVLKWSFPVAVI